jgi:hypothetical protein
MIARGVRAPNSRALRGRLLLGLLGPETLICRHFVP